MLCLTPGAMGRASQVALVVKNPPASSGDIKRHRFNPWVCPWKRKWQLLHYSCLENPLDNGTWQATVHGVAKSWTRLSGPRCPLPSSAPRRPWGRGDKGPPARLPPIHLQPHFIHGSPASTLYLLSILTASSPPCWEGPALAQQPSLGTFPAALHLQDGIPNSRQKNSPPALFLVTLQESSLEPPTLTLFRTRPVPQCLA